MSGLGLAVVEEEGIRFQTGQPVTFRYLRNTVSSQRFRDHRNDLFQQRLDPAGRFMSHVEHPVLQEDPSGRTAWETGVVTFESPLVLWLNNGPTPGAIYDEHSWKARLARHYGATGGALSSAIMEDGFDGIVTVELVRGQRYTSEIVDLRWGRERGWFNNPPGSLEDQIQRARREGDYELVRALESRAGLDYLVTMLDESGETTVVHAPNMEAAKELAEAWARSGDWSWSERTFLLDLRVEGPEGEDGITLEIDPPEPACPGSPTGTHAWAEGPVRGSGGGVAWEERCGYCDLIKVRDTWANDPTSGRPVDSVSYRRDEGQNPPKWQRHNWKEFVLYPEHVRDEIGASRAINEIERALEVGAVPPLEYQGVGMTSTVFCDARGIAYKVGHAAEPAPSRAKILEKEVAWLRAAKRHPATAHLVPEVFEWRPDKQVIVRECVRGTKPPWGARWQEWHAQLDAVPGWIAPEGGDRQWIVTEGGPVLVDGGFALRSGENLAAHIESLLDEARYNKSLLGRSLLGNERVPDLAWALWQEVHKGNVSPARGEPILERLREEAGDVSDYTRKRSKRIKQ